LIDASLVEAMTEEGNNNGYDTPPKEYCGYALIDGRLVPETFIQLVATELQDCVFDYGFVLAEEDIFDQEFVDTLDEMEYAVLMPVVLQLIARDQFPVNLWALEKEEAAA